MPVLDKAFNALTEFMTGLYKWEPVNYDPYANLAEMQADYISTGRIKISTLHSENSIYGDPWVNVCSRAWHDYCHLSVNAEFDAKGERLASDYQIAQMREFCKLNNIPVDKENWFACIIDAEVNGQVDYYLAHGKFPSNGYEFTKGYLGL